MRLSAGVLNTMISPLLGSEKNNLFGYIGGLNGKECLLYPYENFGDYFSKKKFFFDLFVIKSQNLLADKP